MRNAIFLLFVALILSGCAKTSERKSVDSTTPATVQSQAMKERVTFMTSDGVAIVGNWYSAPNAIRVALLLHMIPAVKESWEPLAAALAGKGISALAIDLRGHGESLKREIVDSREVDSGEKELNFQKFSDTEHQESERDVQAAMGWLERQGFRENQRMLVGASIGANLAVKAAANTKTIPKLLLLSPGLEYRGIKADADIKKIWTGTQTQIIVAERDQYAAASSQRLKSLNPSVELSIVSGSAHGTDLFSANPELLSKITDFLSSN